MNIGLEQIILIGVAILCTFLGINAGRKLEHGKAKQEGREEAYRDVQQQSTEQTLERVERTMEARSRVERSSDSELSDQARRDPNNRLGGVQDAS